MNSMKMEVLVLHALVESAVLLVPYAHTSKANAQHLVISLTLIIVIKNEW